MPRDGAARAEEASSFQETGRRVPNELPGLRIAFWTQMLEITGFTTIHTVAFCRVFTANSTNGVVNDRNPVKTAENSWQIFA
jgi:hypothetical protein